MKTRKILVIDDEETILNAVSKTLTNAGFKVLVASSLEEASEIIQNEKLDLIISDVMLPHLGGIELVDRIKEDPDKNHIPVLIMTGMEKDILQMTVSHADAILSKPFTSEQLLTEVRKHIGAKSRVL